MPHISVLLSVLNGAKFVADAVQSILAQSYSDFEFIIVDDGSTDRTLTILQSFADPRIQIIRNEANIGLARSLNKALDFARGEFIARIDADDFSPPERFAKQLQFLLDHPQIDVVGSDMVEVDEHGVRIREKKFPRTPEEVRRTMFVHNPLAHSAVMMRASVLKKVGGYDPNFHHTEDYDLWLRIAKTGEIANIPQPLLTRRLHSANVTYAGEIEMVFHRRKVLRHAIQEYYRNPFLNIYLIRPFFAYWIRRIVGRLGR
jgi:glycosyltransferase involved in cell wall biosynthesis